MKYQSIKLAICFLILSTNINAQNWWGNAIKGEGPIISKDLDLDEFEGFEMAISANVILSKGNKQSVRVEGQANIIDNIKTRVSGKIWDINFDKNTKNHKKVIIYITIPHLTEIELSGSGSVKGEDSFDNLDRIDLSVTGSGNIKLSVSSKKSNCRISGSGNIKLSGESNFNKISITGSGDFHGYNLDTHESKISITGSGDCEVNVSDDLDLNIVGSGDVYYKGKPKLRSNIIGSGDVESVN